LFVDYHEQSDTEQPPGGGRWRSPIRGRV